MPIDRFGVKLPTADELPALPRGVVLHWTGGTGKANSTDLGAYHYVVEADATVKEGRWPVSANMRMVKGREYAMHTGAFNSYRVGISAAGMKDYEGPDDVGAHPLTPIQVERMLELANYFLELGGLEPLDPKHLCTHREVWTLHGVQGMENDRKRDIEYLPFEPELEKDKVGPFLRNWAAELARGIEVPDELPYEEPNITVPRDLPHPGREVVLGQPSAVPSKGSSRVLRVVRRVLRVPLPPGLTKILPPWARWADRARRALTGEG